MGRAFAQERKELPATYGWARSADVSSLSRLIGDFGRLPLLTVGSGGSFSAASFCAFLHELATGVVAKACTPLELQETSLILANANVLLFSARGRNRDVLHAFSVAVDRDARHVGAVCLDAESPLADRTRSIRSAYVPPVSPPVRKDGYLATNSLLATTVLLFRAYQEVFGLTEELPASLHDFTTLPEVAPSFFRRSTVIVLHDLTMRSAALDFESKFCESALSDVQVLDYRNFAHGRHLWLARHGERTGIVAMHGAGSEALAERTLALVPDSVDIVRIRSTLGSALAPIDALLQVLQLTALAGDAASVDVGRPHVPSFGRKLYHLSSKRNRRTLEQRAIERKTGRSVDMLRRDNSYEEWRAAFREFHQRLTAAVFVGVVLDYDGTICGTSERYSGCSAEIIAELERLLATGLPGAIATGRGGSVGTDLRGKLARRYWDRVLVGYYNGAEIAPLRDADAPTRGAASGRLRQVLDRLQAANAICRAATIEARPAQITIEFEGTGVPADCWDRIVHAIRAIDPLVTLARSTHSIDLLAPGVTKRDVVVALRHLAARDGAILCIGDQGRWPGNDADLLREPLSLSVDEVSGDPATCWNLAPDGCRQERAALCYLRALSVTKGIGRMEIGDNHER